MMFNIAAMIGPSGSGKTTIQRYLGFKPIITYTSRAPRNGEVDGVHYHFTTREKVLTMNDNGYLLEYTEYDGNLYASALTAMQEVIKNREVGSIVVDGNGARQLKKSFDEQVLLIGIFASKVECLQRISGRSISNVEERLASYEQEVQQMLELCDIVIMNSEKNWTNNKRILNLVRKGLIEENDRMTL